MTRIMRQGVERARKVCECITPAPPSAEDQAERQARRTIAGTKRGGEGKQGRPGDGGRGRARRRPERNRSPVGERGYWQINLNHGALSTYDPLGNAKAAVIISDNGTNWNPWTTFTSGAYRGRC